MPVGVYVRTKEMRRNMSIGATSKKLSEKTKKKIGLAHKGKKLSEEHKKKNSLAKRGKKNPNWSGGRHKHPSGYIYVHEPNHPHCNCYGYVREHRLAMEKKLGRYLTKKEVVHHINGKKDDNRIENLKLFSNNDDHWHYHYHEKKKKKKRLPIRECHPDDLAYPNNISWLERGIK